MIRPRSKPRRGQPTKAEKTAIRNAAYERAGGLCQIRKHARCSRNAVLPSEGDLFVRAHLVHLKAKRVHGWAPENLAIGCYWCHIESLHNPKSVPAKERAA